MYCFDAPSYFQLLRSAGTPLGYVMQCNEFHNVLFSTLLRGIERNEENVKYMYLS